MITSHYIIKYFNANKLKTYCVNFINSSIIPKRLPAIFGNNIDIPNVKRQVHWLINGHDIMVSFLFVFYFRSNRLENADIKISPSYKCPLSAPVYVEITGVIKCMHYSDTCFKI